MSILPLADASAWLTDHLIPLVGALVVLVGLLVVGRTDLLRFSWQRVWAISGVCFSESIRRRVLWIIPLAIVGLVAIVQLQQPNDEQDAIRQTTKFCLFAAGLVVVLSQTAAAIAGFIAVVAVATAAWRVRALVRRRALGQPQRGFEVSAQA